MLFLGGLNGLDRFNIDDVVVAFGLPSPWYGVFSGPLGQCISVTYPRRTAGRRLDNLGVRMREHFCIFEKFPRSTEIIYKQDAV